MHNQSPFKTQLKSQNIHHIETEFNDTA